MRGAFHAGKLDLSIKLNVNKMFGIKTFLTLTKVLQLEGDTFFNTEGKHSKYYILDGYRNKFFVYTAASNPSEYY